jgi:hypothetical protein
MDRRSFLARAGLLAVGSAFGSSLLGCDTVYLEIPCISVAPAPPSLPGTTFIKASQIGCALDCDLATGSNKHTGGAATDDGPRINAAMAGASASNPITLIIDGSALISGLFLPAGGYWSIAGQGCGTGFFVKPGANNDGIHNGPPNAGIPSDPGPPVPPRGSNVSLSNFVLNGNQGNGFNGDSTYGDSRGNPALEWFYGINLMNLDNITIVNLVVINTPSYHIRLSNVGNVSVSGCLLRTLGTNHDGLHFDGPANDITISNCDFTMGDDAIALNCPEGHGGNISRVSVTNCTFNSFTLMRLYSYDGIYTSLGNANPYKFTIDTVTVSNCSGNFQMTGFTIDDGSGASPNSVTGVTISDCTLTAPSALDLSTNFGTVVLNNVTLIPVINYWQPPGLGFVRSAPLYGEMTYIGSSLTLNNCAVSPNGNLNVPALILQNNSTISNLIFNGFVTQAPELIAITSGSIGQLVLNAVASAQVAAPVSPGGFSSIGSVSGSGVLATSWEFPNDVMADEVPYISANSGLPSIKIDGVVEPYPGA